MHWPMEQEPIADEVPLCLDEGNFSISRFLNWEILVKLGFLKIFWLFLLKNVPV